MRTDGVPVFEHTPARGGAVLLRVHDDDRHIGRWRGSPDLSCVAVSFHMRANVCGCPGRRPLGVSCGVPLCMWCVTQVRRRPSRGVCRLCVCVYPRESYDLQGMQ